MILACRNKAKAETAKAKLIEKTGNTDILAMELDVSSLTSVRTFVEQCKESGLSYIDGLVCNAGISGNNKGLTSDGFDVVFETNHLGHYLLTILLLPLMQEDGRIIVVSSDMNSPPGRELSWPGTRALAKPNAQLADNFVPSPSDKEKRSEASRFYSSTPSINFRTRSLYHVFYASFLNGYVAALNIHIYLQN